MRSLATTRKMRRARVVNTLAGFGQCSRRRWSSSATCWLGVVHAVDATSYSVHTGHLPPGRLFAAEALDCDQKGRSQILGCDTQEAEGYLVRPDGTVAAIEGHDKDCFGECVPHVAVSFA